MDCFEEVPGILRGIVNLNEGAGVVHIRAGYVGRLGDGKHIEKYCRVRGENATEHFEDDVLRLDYDVSVVVPDVLASDKGCRGNERGHVVCWDLEVGHGDMQR